MLSSPSSLSATHQNVTAAETIAELYLDRPSAKTRILAAALSEKQSNYRPICQHLTREDCAEAQANLVDAPSTSKTTSSPSETLGQDGACDQVHFEKIILPQTDPSLGHCSYLNTCHKMHICRYLHFKPIPAPNGPDFSICDASSRGKYPSNPSSRGNWNESKSSIKSEGKHPVEILKGLGLDSWVRDYEKFDPKTAFRSGKVEDAEFQEDSNIVPPAQWLNCDLKNFDYSILGKFDVIMADPPWDIHMSLPYETMTDNDMRSMPVSQLQDEGFIFLWVTGRALELGRELLGLWGYTRVDELIWVKVGQTQRLIRTGRTGHWLNHTKEHCLIGSKTSEKISSDSIPSSSRIPSLSSPYQSSLPSGIPSSKVLPSWANIGLSSDVIVSEVRDTSRKPDEIYKIIERLCPGGRKLELFGRKTNRRKGWITCGNQLNGDYVCELGLKDRVEEWRRKQGNGGWNEEIVAQER